MTVETPMQVSYSQNGEDRIVFPHLSGISRGVVLDIGAGDPTKFSNSMALIERGWRAILVEPSPRHFAKLLAFHGGNPGVTLLNAAIGTENRIVEFHEAEDALYSTTSPAHADKWRGRGMSYRSYWVAQVTIRTMLTQLGGMAHLLSIDAEGISFDILTQCPLAEWDTRAVIVEHDDRIVEIAAWGRDRGYEPRAVNAENIVLVRP